MRKLLSIATFLLVGIAFGQGNTITGFAPSFVGKEVKLYTYQEYITMKKIEIGTGYVNPADSLFKIDLNVKNTVKGIVQIENVEGVLYLAPNTSYNVIFPSREGLTSYNELSTELLFLGLDTTDINYRILQYHQWFDVFVAYHEKEMSLGGFLSLLDTFKTYVADAYKDVDDIYFLTYVRYDIAEMEQTFGGNANANARLKTYLNYIQPFPVYFENDKYMQFIKRFFHQEFEDYDPELEREIFMAIDRASPTLLMKALRSDFFLTQPELRELMMVDKLGKQFYRNNRDKPAILHMLDSVATHGKYMTSANTAKNVLEYLMKLEPGYPAPFIELSLSDDSTLYWDNYKGRFVYLNFFTTWDEKAKTEMRVIKQLKERYDEDISFLSVCVDKDKETFDKYVAENDSLDWDIVYIGPEHPMIKSYKVETYPAYFIIDPGAYIFAAPALSPSPSGAEYFSVDKTFFDIKSALHPPEERIPGQR